MQSLARRIYKQLGHRGLFMLLLGVVQVIYGVGLLSAADTKPSKLHWWPGSVGQLGGFPLSMWGTLWCVIGGLCLVTAPTRADRISYAAAVLLNFGWAIFATQRWIATGEAGAWAPAVIYTGIGVGVFLVAGWPEPASTPLPQLPQLPPPPTPEELAVLEKLIKPSEPSDNSK